MSFGSPTLATTFGTQGPRGVDNRAYFQATAGRAGVGSAWPVPPAAYLPTTTYHVCDAFGDPIPGVGNGFGAAGSTTTILQSHSVIIVYVLDPAAGAQHYHRYFFHIG